MSKIPFGFKADQIIAIFRAAQQAKGEDLPAAWRILREIKHLPQYSLDAEKGVFKLHPIDAEMFLHLKETDAPKVWKWIKDTFFGDGKNVTPALLEGLEETAKALKQEADYTQVIADMTEEEEKPEEVTA